MENDIPGVEHSSRGLTSREDPSNTLSDTSESDSELPMFANVNFLGLSPDLISCEDSSETLSDASESVSVLLFVMFEIVQFSDSEDPRTESFLFMSDNVSVSSGS